ncbi:reverse transcriptase domain-containing protein [Tanacetum coccineum]|uniref:Reverse transcriptase domain-containing protein n=1 Tax=Tanacetum coccineum TaxID=301880 RepID=A0ABQ5I3G4_9ASTR
MFNSTLTGNARVWFNKLPKESIDNYEDLRAAFRENYHQQTKHIKEVEIHHIKQRDGESTRGFHSELLEEVLGSGGRCAMHEDLWIYVMDNPPLADFSLGVERLLGGCRRLPHSGLGRKESTLAMEANRGGRNPNLASKRVSKQAQVREHRKPDRFSLLTKEIFALEKGKFKAPPPMLRKQIVENDQGRRNCNITIATAGSYHLSVQMKKETNDLRTAYGPQEAGKILEERIRGVQYLEYPVQTIAIGTFFLEASGYDGRSMKHCGTLLEYPRGMPTCQAIENRASTRKKQSNPKRSGKTGGCRDHDRSAFT